MGEYKHLIFDVDGTLINNEFAVLSTWKEALFEMWVSWEMKDLTFVLGIPGETSFEKLGFINPKAAFERWGEIFQKYRPTIKLFDNISDTLAALKEKGMQLGIITSRLPSEVASEALLQDVAKYFSTIVCSTDSPRPKPFADPILTYMKKNCCLQEEILYIGDTLYDAECAQNASVDFGLAMWDKSSAKSIAAKYIFNSPKDILSIV